jgi:hypothetical protein
VGQFNVVVILVQSKFKEFYLGDGHIVFKKSKMNFKPNYKYWNVLQDLKVACIHKVQGACEAIQCCSDLFNQDSKNPTKNVPNVFLKSKKKCY